MLTIDFGLLTIRLKLDSPFDREGTAECAVVFPLDHVGGCHDTSPLNRSLLEMVMKKVRL